MARKARALGKRLQKHAVRVSGSLTSCFEFCGFHNFLLGLLGSLHSSVILFSLLGIAFPVLLT